MRISVVRVVIGAILIAVSGQMRAEAQTPGSPTAKGGRIFIEAGAVLDYDQTDFEPPGPALAGGFGIGSTLWQRYSLRFELDIPGEHLDSYGDKNLEHHFSSKTTSYAFLLGRHFRARKKVQIVALGGVSALTHRTHFTGFLDIVPRDGTPPTHTVFDDHMAEQWVALTLGVDVPIVITRHLYLVPQYRAHQVANAELGQLFPSGKNALRPRLSLRWRF